MRSYTIIKAIALRDLAAALRSPRYYILLAFYLFIQGYDFSLLFMDDGAVAMRQLMRDIAFLLLFAAPLVTAASIAGERESGELRNLLTEPVSEAQIVIGKAVAGLGLLLPLILSTFIPLAAAMYYGQVSVAPLLCAIFGLALLAICAGAAGIFASSFSNHPASAAASSLGMLLALAFLGLSAAKSSLGNSFLTGGTGPEALNPFSLADFLFRGVIDSRAIVFFPAATVLFLYLAVVMLKSRRWTFSGSEGPETSRSWLLIKKMRITMLPALCIFGMVHLANVHVHFSHDLSGYLKLSPVFQSILSELPDKLIIYRLTSPSDSRNRLADFLDEVRRAGGDKISIEIWSPRLHFTKLRPLGLLVPPQNGLVLQMGSAVTAIPGESLHIQSKEGERELAKAINRLQPNKSAQKIFLSEGHGETSTKVLERLLATEGFACTELSIPTVKKIKTESSVLAIIGPRLAFQQDETDKIRNFLNEGGSLLLCIDHEYPKAAASLLALLPVTSTGRLIIDESRCLTGAGPTSLIISPFEGHAITKMIGKINLVMQTALGLEFSPPTDTPLHKRLIKSAASACYVNKASQVGKRELWQRDDIQTLALTVEGAKLKSPYRAAVIGDSDMLSDRILFNYPTHAAFAAAVFSWLREEEAPNSIPRKAIYVAPNISRSQARDILFLMTVLPPFFALFCGFFAYRSYRKKFRK